MKTLKRILALAPDCHTPVNYSHLAWRRHIYEGIRPHVERLIIPEELDFTWARQGHGRDLTPFADQKRRNSEQLWDRIRAAHSEHGLDAVITYCFDYDLELDVLRDTVKLGVPWINFFCDSTHMFERVEPIARLTSLNWFPESDAEPRYRALGVPYICAPYAWNPEWLPDLTNREPLRPAAFIGLPTANRITQLGWLRVHGCPVEIRGHGWVGGDKTAVLQRQACSETPLESPVQRQLIRKDSAAAPLAAGPPMARGPLSDAEFGEYVLGSLVVLGLNQAPDAQGRLTSYLKFRDMEFPGYGCCYLTEHNADLPRVLEVEGSPYVPNHG